MAAEFYVVRHHGVRRIRVNGNRKMVIRPSCLEHHRTMSKET
jgi:hypothetical protein